LGGYSDRSDLPHGWQEGVWSAKGTARPCWFRLVLEKKTRNSAGSGEGESVKGAHQRLPLHDQRRRDHRKGKEKVPGDEWRGGGVLGIRVGFVATSGPGCS